MTQQCFKCKEDINLKYKIQVSVKYGGLTSIGNRAVCPSCISELFFINKDEVKFEIELVNFRKENKLRWYDTWNKKELYQFIKILESQKIPLADYESVLWSHRKDRKRGYGYDYIEVRLGDLLKGSKTQEVEEKVDYRYLNSLLTDDKKRRKVLGIE